MKHLLGGGDTPFIKPNVSHCIEENEVHYNPLIPVSDTIVVEFDTNAENVHEQFVIYEKSLNTVDEIRIDGNVINVEDLNYNDYPYSLDDYSFMPSIGHHIIEYVLNENNLGTIPEDFFAGNGGSIFWSGDNAVITIPQGTTTIENRAFSWINDTEIVIPDTVTSFGDCSFCCAGIPNDLIERITENNPNAYSDGCK